MLSICFLQSTLITIFYRDDEHCTALILAANSGHVSVMKILLDNHASVNDCDKMKVRFYMQHTQLGISFRGEILLPRL